MRIILKWGAKCLPGEVHVAGLTWAWGDHLCEIALDDRYEPAPIRVPAFYAPTNTKPTRERTSTLPLIAAEKDARTASNTQKQHPDESPLATVDLTGHRSVNVLLFDARSMSTFLDTVKIRSNRRPGGFDLSRQITGHILVVVQALFHVGNGPSSV